MLLLDYIKQKLWGSLHLHRALHLVWKSGPRWTIISIVLLSIQGLLPLLSLYLIKLVIDAVTAGIANPDIGAAVEHVIILVIVAGVVMIVSNVLESVATLVNSAQAEAVTDYTYGLLHAKSIEVDLEYYEDSQYQDTLHRAQEEASYRPIRVLTGLIQFGKSSVSVLAIGAFLFAYHWGIAAVLITAAVPGIFVRLRYEEKMYQWQRQKTQDERRANYYHWILTGEWYAKEVRLFNLGHVFAERFKMIRQQLRREKLRLDTTRSLMQLTADVGSIIAMFLVYGFIAYKAVHGLITLGELVMYYAAFQRLQGSLKGMFGSMASLYSDNLFLANLYELFDLRPKVAEPLHPKPVPRPMQQGVEIEHVSFQYPGSDRKVLNDISLTVQPGEKIALVGENGAGKTTLIKLLCRLYDPTNGSIMLDGIDLREFSTTALRHEFSAIFQDYTQYHLTVRENIWLGNTDCRLSDESVKLAARNAGIHDVITGLHNGYDTTLGRWFEGGEELSIGQWQKIALARAFMRNAQITLLDEPTSALDPKAEGEVLGRFLQLTKSRTAIWVSHRLSTTRKADHIYVLEDGRIVEHGTHDELMQCKGKYAHLFAVQARNYQ